jgi:hypothetical protein
MELPSAFEPDIVALSEAPLRVVAALYEIQRCQIAASNAVDSLSVIRDILEGDRPERIAQVRKELFIIEGEVNGQTE